MEEPFKDGVDGSCSTRGNPLGSVFIDLSQDQNETSPLVPPATVHSHSKAQELEGFDDSDSDHPQCRICLESDGDMLAPCKCKGSARFVHRECLDQWRSIKEGFAFSHCTTCRTRFLMQPNVPPDQSQRRMRFRLLVTRDLLFVTLASQMMIALLGYTVFVADSYAGFWLKSLLHFESVTVFYYLCGALSLLVLAGILGLVFVCVDSSFREDVTQPCRELGTCCCDPLLAAECQMSSTPYCFVAPDLSASCCSGCAECLTSAAPAVGGGEAGLVLLGIGAFVLILLAIAGLFYLLVVGTVVVQRVWQRHHHVLAKRELTQEYIVQDLSALDLPPDWSAPSLPPEHEAQLQKMGLL